MTIQRGFSFISAIGLAAGVAVAGTLGYTIKKTSDRVVEVGQQMTNIVDSRMSDFIRAIPGERYNQLIDDLYGEDPDKKKRAQAFLTRLAGIDFNTSLQVSAAFGFNETPPIRAQIFPILAPTGYAIKTYLSESENLKPIRSTILAAPSSEERRAKIIATTRNLIENSDAVRRAVLDCNAPTSIPQLEGFPFDPVSWCKDPTNHANADKTKRIYEKLFEDLADAQLAAYHQGTTPIALPAERLTITWNQLRDQYIVLTVVEKDLEQHKNDPCVSDGKNELPGKGCIRIWAHAKDEPEKIAYEGGIFNVSLMDFYTNPAIPNTVPGGGNIRYVIRRPDPTKMFDAETLEAYRLIQRIRKEQSQAIAASAANQ